MLKTTVAFFALMTRHYILLLLVIFSTSVATGQLSAVDSVRFVFRQGEGQYDSGFSENDLNMRRLTVLLKSRDCDSLYSIEVCGNASPDGFVSVNRRLSEERRRSITNKIIEVTGVAPSLIKSRAVGVSWDGLRRMVETNERVPYRDEVLRLLDNTPLWIYDKKGRVVGGRKKSLMELRRGVPYLWMYDSIFPELRNAVSVIVTTGCDNGVVESKDSVERIDTLEDAAGVDISLQDTIINEVIPDVSSVTVTVHEDERPSWSAKDEPIHRFALKTNIVYDALLMPSLELEWRVTDRWSLSIEGDVAWWKNDRRHKYYQVAAFIPEVRRWFRTRAPWHGMYIGAFAGGGKYDLENGRTGYKGEGGMAGISFGYMWPISRALSLEAAVGAGYMFTRYREYEPHDGHYLYQRTKDMNYFGPLKVKFALVWRFDDINRKGGAR